MIINNARIIAKNKEIANGYVVIEGKKIIDVKEGPYLGTEKNVFDAKGNMLLPGFIDIHTHGSVGIDVMDAEGDDYKKIAESLYKEGTTTFLATTVTADFKSLLKVCKNVKAVIKEVPSLGGVHLEGPYINAKYKGAQNEAFIKDPNVEEFNKLQKASGKNIRLIAMAPERPNSEEFIKTAVASKCVVSAGHSDASFAQMEMAIDWGLSSCTHLHNAMSAHHHRNPGIVTAAFCFDNLYKELIVDGIHVNKDAIKATYKICDKDHLIAITDALCGKHTNFDNFKLGGLDVVKKDGAAYLTSGPLAGSLLTMNQGIKNIKSFTGANFVELAKFSSTNAAKMLGFKDRGVIAKGKLADLTLINKDTFEVLSVYKAGNKVI